MCHINLESAYLLLRWLQWRYPHALYNLKHRPSPLNHTHTQYLLKLIMMNCSKGIKLRYSLYVFHVIDIYHYCTEEPYIFQLMYKESGSRTRQIAFFGLWLWLWETGSYILIFQVRFLNSTLLYILKDFCPASDSVWFWIMWHCSLLQGKMGIAGTLMFKEKKLHWHLFCAWN